MTVSFGTSDYARSWHACRKEIHCEVIVGSGQKCIPKTVLPALMTMKL
jgi:hypothetical protein